ncbi:hypothetical protein S83_035671 [Arachis hypogaea]
MLCSCCSLSLMNHHKTCDSSHLISSSDPPPPSSKMQDSIGIPACFSSSPSKGGGDEGGGGGGAVTLSGQSVYMSVYRTKIADNCRKITITWCKNLLLHGLSVSVEGPKGDTQYAARLSSSRGTSGRSKAPSASSSMTPTTNPFTSSGTSRPPSSTAKRNPRRSTTWRWFGTTRLCCFSAISRKKRTEEPDAGLRLLIQYW